MKRGSKKPLLSRIKCYLIALKFPLFLLTFLCAVECFLIVYHASTFPLGLLKLVLVFYFGFYFASKKKFNLKQTLIEGKLLFIPSLMLLLFNFAFFFEDIPLNYRLFSYFLVLLLNLVISLSCSFAGWLIAKIYLKLKKRR